MIHHLAKRRTVWVPTLGGWVLLIAVGGASGLLWWFDAESFLSPTRRLPAEVLVVEGWIGIEAIRGAAAEFEHGGYRFLVTTGGLSSARWSEKQGDYAAMAEYELIRAGVQKDKIIAAHANDTARQRTFEVAAAAWWALTDNNLHPTAVNVFTVGPHARRSRLVFAKVFGSATEIGVISWVPPVNQGKPWWHSSERADDLFKETIAYVFELLLNSGRGSNAPISQGIEGVQSHR